MAPPTTSEWAVQVLRRRVHDEVGAELERALEVWCHEGVVDGDAHAASVAELRDGRDVEEAQQRVRGRLDPREARARADGGGDGARVARVDVGEGEAHAAEDLVEETEGAAVESSPATT